MISKPKILVFSLFYVCWDQVWKVCYIIRTKSLKLLMECSKSLIQSHWKKPSLSCR